MKWLWIFAIPILMGMTPIHNTHRDQGKIDEEFKNLYDQAQSRQFTVVTTTPNYTDIQDGEIVIYSSSPFIANINLMLRVGTTIYVSPMFPIMRGR